MSAEALCLAGDAALLSLAVAGAFLSRRPFAGTLVYGGSLVLSALLLFVAIDALLIGARGEPLVLPLGLPWIGARFRIDALSAFFLVVVNLGGAAASLYGLGYGRAESSPERVLPFFPAFLAGMNLVLVADDAYTFLLSWEFMSLSSWALVMAHHRDHDNARAGYVYLVMASFGTLALLLAFALLAGPAGGYAFDAMRTAGPPPGVAGLAFILALIGAGSKAGIVPLHVWLPLAHPAAPSHVSALMSGVMTKVAVYGFVRIVFDLAGPATWWWSVPVLTVGAGAALLGVIYALMQHDLKRLLAYHTVENIGIIFIGLGLALGFKAFDMPAAASLALTAGLLHVFNHSLFKSLLFFGAGAVLSATGERDMERLGGLIHTMPRTAFFFLVGCVAISALPPFNGFVSEWLTFQAILLSPPLPSWVLKILAPAVGAVLALSAALAAACFCKAFGITFLGRPRTEAERARGRSLFPRRDGDSGDALPSRRRPSGSVDRRPQPATQIAVGAHMPTQSSIAWLSIAPVAESRSSYNGLLVFLFIVLSATLAAASSTVSPPPRCGARLPGIAAFPIRRPRRNIQRKASRSRSGACSGRSPSWCEERIDMPPPGETRPARLDLRLSDRIWDALYLPLILIVERAAVQLNRLQFLTIRQYLSVVFGALVVLLLVLASWP